IARRRWSTPRGRAHRWRWFSRSTSLPGRARQSSYRRTTMLKGFEHIGMAVSDLDRSIAFYRDLLGMKVLKRKMAPNGGAELAFMDTGNGQLELICPSPSVAAPAKRLPDNEAGVRHLTFAFENIEETYQQLMAAGV